MPSIAIREGVLKNLEITHEHFQNIYDKIPLNFEVYDLLPISNPEFFPPQNKEPHLEWIKTICKYSNNIICISKDVEQKLKELILNEKIKTKQNKKKSKPYQLY